MTPQTPVIDRAFKGVGRIKRATGTTAPKMREALSRMLTSLYQQGRLDVLRAIRDGKLTLLVVYDAHRRHALNSLPMADTLAPLETTMRAWMDNADASKKHRSSWGTSLKYLLGVKTDAQVNELPMLLEQLRNTLGVKHPRSFNLARNAASRFVAATLKKNHPLYAAILAVELRKIEIRRKGRPLSIVQMKGFFPAPDTDPLDAIAWGMVTTGMNEKEYWRDGWSVESDHIHVTGKKRRARDRMIPLVQAPAVPTMHERTFTNKLRERTNRKIQPYDLRRTYANWMESAGIPRTRRMIYMGHGTKDVTDLYERHEVEAFVKEDAKKMQKYLHLRPTKAHTMKRGLRAI